MSTFAGADLFGSGPHTLAVGPRGQQWARSIDLGTPAAGIELLGDHTATVHVRGLLTAADPAALDALTAALESAAGTKGTLTGNDGRAWTGLTLVEVVYDGPPQSGRLTTIPYRVLFAAV